MTPFPAHLLEHVVPVFYIVSPSRIITGTYRRTLTGRLSFQQYISEMLHVPNASRFCVKMWCQYQLYG